MAQSYKSLKEQHVSNLSGGPASEINVVTAVAFAKRSFFTPYTLPAAITDFLLNAGGLLFAITLYANYPVLLNIALLTTAAAVYLSSTGQKKAPAKPKGQGERKDKAGDEANELPRRGFITTYRGGMMVITCLAILAVDFRVFPRRFAKVESWGTSLMDQGQGSFVFSGGLVSVRSFLKAKRSSTVRPLHSRLYTAVRHSVPLLALGLIRLYSVKGLEYPEHVTEYGVHWNFFFTLGLLPPFVACFESLFTLVPSFSLLAVFLAATYETVLDNTSLAKFILTAPRVDLLSQNREGIFSFIGYLAIFLAGQATGMVILPRTMALAAETSLEASLLNRLSKRITPNAKLQSAVAMVCWSGFWIALFEIATSYSMLGLLVSRRLANLGYVLWVVAFNVTHLTGFYVAELFFFEKPQVSRLLHAFNRNGLAIFLVANLMTGAVNLAFRTLDFANVPAVALLGAYAMILAVFALTLDHFGLTLVL